MPKYLLHGTYNLVGARGLLKEGGSSRKSHISEIITYLGGRVESFYYAFGCDDVYAIVELPDNVSAAALSLAFGSGGGFRADTVVLLTSEEIDRAAAKVASIGYRPPGHAR